VKRLSPRMRSILQHINDGRAWTTGLKGRSEFGGASQSLRALKERGYVTGVPNMCQITPAGRKALQP
jgi:hypothetical protein